MLNKIKRNKKGFTLAELLIVVAIIAILAAIAIPTFTSANKKAYDGVAEANARSAFGEWAVEFIATGTAPTKDTSKITYNAGAKYETVCTVTNVDTAGGDLTLTIKAEVKGNPADTAPTFSFSTKSN